MDSTQINTNNISKYKTKPYNHQLDCLNKFGRDKAFALFAEMGTGKTWIIINNIADLWSTHEIDAVLIMAPNGVHENWTRIEMLKHMPDWVRYRAATWCANPNKKEKAAINDIFGGTDSTELRVFTMNWEALQNKRGTEAAFKFARSCRHLMIVCDESDNMKNPSTARSKAMMKLKPMSDWRRIMSGTPINNGPFDLFSQFSFLDETILGTTSFYAFKSEYAEILQPGHPLLSAIQRKIGANKRLPQIVEKDKNGKPRYRNLEKLTAIIAPHMYRVMKKDCLDLPDKIYKTVLFDLTPVQRAIYEKAENEHRLALDGKDTPFNQLVAQGKLCQITSGYYLHPLADEPVRIEGPNPKMDVLAERVAQIKAQDGKIIIWARYRVQIADIAERLAQLDPPVKIVQYHGGVKKKERTEAIDAFESGDADVFLGQQQAGGSGITLVGAAFVTYFSNDFSLRNRLQSEDRAHRIGQSKNVVYLNICGKNSIDESIVLTLDIKESVAYEILDKKADHGKRTNSHL